MADFKIEFDALEVGMLVGFSKGGAGRRGVILALPRPGVAHMESGTDKIRWIAHFGDYDRVVEEHPLAPEECISFHEGNCVGDVEWRGAPSGSAIERCEFHNAERWDQYQSSETERYADSDVPPPGFDPAYAGERWDDEY